MNLQKLLLAVFSTTVYANKRLTIATVKSIQKFKRDTDYRPETSLADRLLQCNFRQCNSEQAKNGKDLAILVNNLVKYGPASYFNFHEEGRYMDPKKIYQQLSDWKDEEKWSERYLKPFFNLGMRSYSSAYEPHYTSIGSGIPLPHFWNKSKMDIFLKVHKSRDLDLIEKYIYDYMINILKDLSDDKPTEAARVLRSKLCRDLSSSPDPIARSVRSYRPRDYEYGFEDGSGDELFRTKRHSVEASFSEKCARSNDRNYRLKHCTEGAIFDRAIAEYMLNQYRYIQLVRNICDRFE